MKRDRRRLLSGTPMGWSDAAETHLDALRVVCVGDRASVSDVQRCPVRHAESAGSDGRRRELDVGALPGRRRLSTSVDRGHTSDRSPRSSRTPRTGTSAWTSPARRSGIGTCLSPSSQASPPERVLATRRISELRNEVRRHRFEHARVERRRRSVVEIDEIGVVHRASAAALRSSADTVYTSG